MHLTPDSRKRYRAIGHGLKPVVTIAGKGLSEGVMIEVNRALDDHELIKIRLAVEDREERRALIEAICRQARCELVQNIGKTALIVREAKTPKTPLSNIR